MWGFSLGSYKLCTYIFLRKNVINGYVLLLFTQLKIYFQMKQMSPKNERLKDVNNFIG